MTCAPRGILSTKSASVGRIASVAGRPASTGTTTPSAAPMRSSWATTPAWVWNSPPGVERDEVAALLASISRTWSPSAKVRLTARSPARRRPEPQPRAAAPAARADQLDRHRLDARGPLDQPAERAHLAGGRRAPHAGHGAQRRPGRLGGLGLEAGGRLGRGTEEERVLGAGRASPRCRSAPPCSRGGGCRRPSGTPRPVVDARGARSRPRSPARPGARAASPCGGSRARAGSTGSWRPRYSVSQRSTLPNSTAASSSRLWPVATTS